MGATDDIGLLIDAEPDSAQSAARGGQGAVTAELIGLADEMPLLLFPGSDTAVKARTTVDLHADHIGQDVVVVFDAGDRRQPIVIGRIRGAQHGRAKRGRDGGAAQMVEIEADGQRVQFAAAGQLVLRCGRASITLTRAGKVLVQGTYVSSCSSGVNRIKGGSIQLN